MCELSLNERRWGMNDFAKLFLSDKFDDVTTSSLISYEFFRTILIFTFVEDTSIPYGCAQIINSFEKKAEIRWDKRLKIWFQNDDVLLMNIQIRVTCNGRSDRSLGESVRLVPVNTSKAAKMWPGQPDVLADTTTLSGTCLFQSLEKYDEIST